MGKMLPEMMYQWWQSWARQVLGLDSKYRPLRGLPLLVVGLNGGGLPVPKLLQKVAAVAESNQQNGFASGECGGFGDSVRSGLIAGCEVVLQWPPECGLKLVGDKQIWQRH